MCESIRKPCARSLFAVGSERCFGVVMEMVGIVRIRCIKRIVITCAIIVSRVLVT